MKQKIVAFHQDEFDDWVADLACGHTQHVRHNPPFFNRPWVLDEAQRAEKIGYVLECLKCERQEVSSSQ